MARNITITGGSALPDYTGNAINSMIANKSADRRFALETARNARLDKLASLREARLTASAKREEQRYQDTKAEKAAALKVATTFSDPIEFDTSVTKRDVYDTGSVIPEYDSDKLQKMYDSGELDTKQVKEIETLKLNEENIQIENAFKDIDLDPKIEKKDRDKLKRQFLIDKGFSSTKDGEEDSGIQKLFKGAGRTMSRPYEYAHMIGENLVGMFSPEKEREYRDFNIKENKMLNDFYKVDEDPLDLAKERIAKLNNNRAKNTEIRTRNQDKKNIEAKRIKELTDTALTGKGIKQTKYDTKSTPITVKEMKSTINKEAKTRADDIRNSNIPQVDKNAQLLALAKTRKESLDQVAAYKILNQKEKDRIQKNIDTVAIDKQKKQNAARIEAIGVPQTEKQKLEIIKLKKQNTLLDEKIKKAKYDND